jgi:integrase
MTTVTEDDAKLESKKRGKAKARGNGRGTVFKLPDGRYRWQYRNAEGKVLASAICPDKTSAEKALSGAITDQERGTLASADRVTVHEYARTWLEAQKGLRTSTRRMYTTDIAHALEIPTEERKKPKEGKEPDVRSLLGKMNLRDVRPAHIKAVLLNLSNRTMKGGRGTGKKMCSRTLGMVRTRLKAVFTEAVQEQIIYVNPVAAVKRLKASQDEVEHVGTALDFDQAAHLREIGEALHTAGVCRLWPAIFTAVSVGLRRGECVALRWQDLDLENGLLMVRLNLTENNGEPILSAPKTKGSIRDIPMPSSLKTVLKAHREATVLERKALGLGSLNPTTPVFATELGKYPHPANLSRAVKGLIAWSHTEPVERKARTRGEVRKPAKFIPLEQRMRAIHRDHRPRLEAIIRSGKPLPEISPHDLRHTAGTQMLRRGMPVEVVSKILGHARVSITLDVYRHVLESEKKAVMVDLYPNPVPVRTVQAVAVN